MRGWSGLSTMAAVSERDVAVPPWRARSLLAHGDPQRPDELRTRAPRLDHVVDVSPLGRDERVGEPLRVLVDERAALAGGILVRGQLTPVENIHRPFGTHDGDLGRRPGDVEVGADV